MRARRLGVVALLLALMGMALVWEVSPPATPPLYDGLAIPLQPYRYVPSLTPPGVQSGGLPSSTRTTLPFPLSDGLELDSSEGPPQISLYFPAGSLVVSSPSSVTISAAPEAPPALLPAGRLHGNAYSISFTDPGASVSVHAPYYVALREPKAVSPAPVVEYWDGKGWEVLRTSPGFAGIPYTFGAQVPGPGVVALVEGVTPQGSPVPVTAAAPARSSGPSTGLLVFLVVAMILGVGLLLLRRSSRRGAKE